MEILLVLGIVVVVGIMMNDLYKSSVAEINNYKGKIASSCPPHDWVYLEEERGGGMQCCNCLMTPGSIKTSGGDYGQ